MENIKRVLIALFFLFISCSEDPPTIPPVEPPPELYYTCNIDEAKNCTLEENIGVCQLGIQICILELEDPLIATVWSECTQTIFPSEEICDNLDNNCNGTLDEVKPLECHPPGFEGLGLTYNNEDPYSICHMGYLDCVEGEWQTCEGYVGPENEVCDGLDNNCNGVIDSDVDYGDCGISEEGMCMMGINYCIDGDLHCIDAVFPEVEICDNIDNNCDGDTDEDLSRVCSTICEIGEEVCEEGHWVDCSARQPQEEVCNNHDDDCDGEIDEDLTLMCYDGPEETMGIGECAPGISECSMGIWGPCDGQTMPQDEICDDLDNDCDGIIDNPETFYESTDIVFILDVSGSMCTYVDDLVDAIADYTMTIVGSDHYFSLIIHGYDSYGTAMLHTNLTDIFSFLGAIMDQTCEAGSLEPTYDVLYDVANPMNNFGLSWRSHATPIIIVIGDEFPQTRRGLIPDDLIPLTEHCLLPGCNSATNENWTDDDPLEIFVITRPSWFPNYMPFVFGEGLRYFNLNTAADGISIGLDLIFREICVD